MACRAWELDVGVCKLIEEATRGQGAIEKHKPEWHLEV